MTKFIALSVLAFATAANAQNNDPAKGKLDVFSTVGVSKVHENYKPASGKSI